MQVYLAGPDVFLPDPVAIAAAKKAICQTYGLVGRFPLDTSLDGTTLTPVEFGLAIYRSNIALMNACDLIIANMTPFRGPSMDVGTAFEMGYMAAQGKPVFGYSNDGRLYVDRVPAVAPEKDADGLTIEAFQLHDNLMLEGAIITSQGHFTCADRPADRYYTDLTVFEAIVQLAAAQLTHRTQP